MISVASFMRGEPVDFESIGKPENNNEEISNNSDKDRNFSNNIACPSEYDRESYFANYEQFSVIEPKEYDRPAMRFPFMDEDDSKIETETYKNKNEIAKIDNPDLKLRYYLGGLYKEGKENDYEYQCNYWECDINCSCIAVQDDERLTAVKNFISYHKITNEDFLRLSYAYLTGNIMKYNGTYSPLFKELDKVLLPYNYNIKKYREIPDNDFREIELKKIVSDSIVKDFCIKHKLSIIDFITLAKTSLNYRFSILRGLVNFDNKFGKELSDIIKSYNLYLPLEDVEKYREEYKSSKEISELTIDVRRAQKRYLQLMKKLLIENPELAIKMISEELTELGFTSRKDIKRLVFKKR